MAAIALPRTTSLQPTGWPTRAGLGLLAALGCLMAQALSPDVAQRLVHDLGGTNAWRLVFLLPLGLFGVGLLIFALLRGAELPGALAATFLAVALYIGVSYASPWLARMGAGPSVGPLAGWAYVMAADDVEELAGRITDAGSVPSPATRQRLLPNLAIAPVAEVIAAAERLEKAPPLLGDEARRFVLAARLTGYLTPDQSQDMLDRRFVPHQATVAAREFAQAHVPATDASLLVQDAWLRLVGESDWSRPMTETIAEAQGSRQ